jgi:hypothetical protein
MPTETWLNGAPIPLCTVELAVQAERWGFDGLQSLERKAKA